MSINFLRRDILLREVRGRGALQEFEEIGRGVEGGLQAYVDGWAGMCCLSSEQWSCRC